MGLDCRSLILHSLRLPNVMKHGFELQESSQGKYAES